jgi:hypothetical protein
VRRFIERGIRDVFVTYEGYVPVLGRWICLIKYLGTGTIAQKKALLYGVDRIRRPDHDHYGNSNENTKRLWMHYSYLGKSQHFLV